MDYHIPVLLKETIEGLALKTGGTYVDVTFGGGGHSREILSRLKEGRLFGFDQDEDAALQSRKIEERSFTFIQANFRHIKKFLRLYGVKEVDGILADLGISSHQIDEPERGFSTRFDHVLDMRMDRSGPITAREVLNTYPEKELVDIFSRYGEVRNARTLAAEIIRARALGEIKTTGGFRELLDRVAPRGAEFKYYARVFQALRIEVNDEIGALKSFLDQALEVLKPGGRLVVISYHSLEDRLVKNLIRKGNTEGIEEKDFYGNTNKPLIAINKKPIAAGEEEIKQNSRARSARLRIAEKI
ncbi:MAG: 16S rRNA (cytosine(1402)-N(4))-methyltransferase RsmH [Cyclobacteriaceae bacterium]|nr:16S rRNA (cytosine(1402)-N(4))-methyltransferase RsmH [Cyclobacteriaceae bacterium]